MWEAYQFELFEKHVSQTLSDYHNILKSWFDYYAFLWKDAGNKEKAAMIIDNAAEKINLLKKEL